MAFTTAECKRCKEMFKYDLVTSKRSYCDFCRGHQRNIEKKSRTKPSIKKHREEYRRKPENMKRHANYLKKYRQNITNIEREKESRKKYIQQIEVKAQIRESGRKYDRLPIRREYKRECFKSRMKVDSKFRLNHNIRKAVSKSLHGNKNGRHWGTLVGYTVEQLKKHLEKRFMPGMTWDNYGLHGWHIDHIIPISTFNFDKPEHMDFKRCWALKNLQPLWAKENVKKNNKLNKPFQPSLKLNG